MEVVRIRHNLSREVEHAECRRDVFVRYIRPFARDIITAWTFGAIEVDGGGGVCDNAGTDK